MSTTVRTSIVIAALALAGCKGPANTPQRPVSQQEPSAVATRSVTSVAASSAVSSAMMPSDNPRYVAYSAAEVQQEAQSVLFFHASWCPDCKADDDLLKEGYANGDFSLTTFKVDYDGATELKARYGVVSQHTYVVVDKQGRELKKLVSPSDSELRQLLGGSAQRNTSSTADADDDAMAGVDGRYTAYTDGVVGNGEPAVLFFHATWCPQCQENDRRLTALYGDSAQSVSVYKIDYDTQAALKAQYGVVQQDTFIRLDAEGNELERVSFPTEAQLTSLIAG